MSTTFGHSMGAPGLGRRAGIEVLPMSPATWAAVAQELSLPPQQVRIVELLLCGRRDKEICAELGLALPTVRTYLNRTFERVGVQDRVELILRVFAMAQQQASSHG